MSDPEPAEVTLSLLDGWLSGAQVAAMLGVTPSRVGQLRREHRLEGIPTPLGGYLYHRADVADLLARRPGPER